MVLAALAAEDDRAVIDSAYQFHLALVGNTGLEDGAFKEVQEKARNEFFQLLGNIRPWEKTTSAERKAHEVNDLRQRYIRRFGDPSDPAFQKKLEEEFARLDARNEAARLEASRETDQERIERRVRERNERFDELRKRLNSHRRR